MSDVLTKTFLATMNGNANPLAGAGFSLDTHESKGFAHFIKYRRNGSAVEFIFGPPEFQIEMIIYTGKGRFAFRDLLSNKDISSWVSKNRYVSTSDRNVENEILWFVRLLEFSLPYLV